MRLLIVKLSAFGDIIHALPALEDLRARPEHPEIHWLVDTRYRFVTEVFPAGVHVHALPLKSPDRWREGWRVIRALRRCRFDAVLDLQGLIKSAVLARLIGTPVFGLDAEHLRERAAGWLQASTPVHPEERHVIQQLRRVAAAPFAPDPAPPESPLPLVAPRAPCTETMRQAGAQTLVAWGVHAPFAWLHAGGGWATKQLPLPTWQAVAKGLAARGITPLIGWGNTVEHETAQAIAKAVPDAIVARARLDITPLCGVLAAADVAIGPDTGVIHLAAALGAPTVSFWGPSASWRSGPAGPRHRHVESHPACGPCFQRRCDRFICMDMLEADDILAAVDELLA